MLTNDEVSPMLQGQQTTIILIIHSMENDSIIGLCIYPK